MKRYLLPTTIGICLALASVGRADDVTPTSGFRKAQPPCPPVCPPACPPVYQPGQAVPVPSVPGQPGTTPPGTLPPTGITPPGTTPPGTTPPGTTPPGTTPPAPTPAPASQAPSTDSFAQAPAAGTPSGESFNTAMIGDLAAGSFILGTVPHTEFGFVTQRTFRGPNGQGFLQTTVRLTNGTTTQNTVIPFQFTGSPSTRTQSFTRQTTTQALIPQTGRGAFKIAENESPRPTDRVFLTYNYFNGVGSGIPNIPTFDTNRETFGFEKTFLQGDASIGMRFNTLQNTGDGSLGNSVFGDIHVVSKYALINDYDTGNVLSGGLVVSIPTGPDAILPDGSRIDPVLLQPWYGGIWNRDKFFLQGFSSVVIPTDSRDSILSLSDLGVGYKLFQATDCSDSIINYIVPTSEVHVTIPYSKHGVDHQPVGVPDIVVLTNGIHIGIGRATDFTLAVAVPVTGPKTFDVEAVAQLNWRFGASARRTPATPNFAGN
jgi:hypothetical protein